MSEREPYDANLVDVWLVCDEPICKDDLVLVHRFARMAQSEHAARLETEARVEAWKALAKEAVMEFEDARGYANSYFAEKWGYDETSKRFADTIRALETGGEQRMSDEKKTCRCGQKIKSNGDEWIHTAFKEDPYYCRDGFKPVPA